MLLLAAGAVLMVPLRCDAVRLREFPCPDRHSSCQMLQRFVTLLSQKSYILLGHE